MSDINLTSFSPHGHSCHQCLSKKSLTSSQNGPTTLHTSHKKLHLCPDSLLSAPINSIYFSSHENGRAQRLDFVSNMAVQISVNIISSKKPPKNRRLPSDLIASLFKL